MPLSYTKEPLQGSNLKRRLRRGGLEEGGGASVLQQENVYYSWCLILLLGAKFNLQWYVHPNIELAVVYYLKHTFIEGVCGC